MSEDFDKEKAINALLEYQRRALKLLHEIDDKEVNRFEIISCFPYIYAYTIDLNSDAATEEGVDSWLKNAGNLIKVFISDQKKSVGLVR